MKKFILLFLFLLSWQLFAEIGLSSYCVLSFPITTEDSRLYEKGSHIGGNIIIPINNGLEVLLGGEYGSLFLQNNYIPLEIPVVYGGIAWVKMINIKISLESNIIIGIYNVSSRSNEISYKDLFYSLNLMGGYNIDNNLRLGLNGGLRFYNFGVNLFDESLYMPVTIGLSLSYRAN
ncbi:MAG: hypothetical protein PF447_03975 [Spirochaetaceae bacterium]|nr:hypothetical protein [Spirochaetaceae bacterium]